MLSIKNNMMAENAARYLGKSYSSLSKSVERLSSGQRINSAKDDAAGLAVRELIRADVAQLRQSSRNAQDAVSMLQTAEGAMAVIDDLLVRMKELAEQASTDSYSSDQKDIMTAEFNQLGSEISRIAASTKFNGTNLLGVGEDTFNFNLGSASITIEGQDMTADGLGVGGTAGTAEFISGRGVSAKTENYFTGGTAGDHIDFTFTNGGVPKELTVTLGVGSQTLQQVVDSLNSQSRSAIEGWNVATAEYNAATGQYALKLANSQIGDIVDASLTVAPSTATAKWAANAGDDTITKTDFVSVNGTSSTAIDLAAANGATGASALVTAAIKTKDNFRAQLGYIMNRLDSATSVLDIQAENLAAAESRISDADVATEMAAMTRNQVLAQAGISMLAQANGMPQMAMKLLG